MFPSRSIRAIDSESRDLRPQDVKLSSRGLLKSIFLQLVNIQCQLSTRHENFSSVPDSGKTLLLRSVSSSYARGKFKRKKPGARSEVQHTIALGLMIIFKPYISSSERAIESSVYRVDFLFFSRLFPPFAIDLHLQPSNFTYSAVYWFS